MKKLTRIGAFTIIAAIAILLAATQRAYTPLNTSTGPYSLGSDAWWGSPQMILSPQKLQLSFSTNNQLKISVYVLDTQAFEHWKLTHEVKPIISIENQSSYVSTHEIPEREAYAILVHNEDQSPVSVTIGMTLYGFETDLLVAVAVLASIGIAAIIAQKLVDRKPN